MKLIIIHGPPAVGKLTVARQIEKRTGFKVFHNHLSIDCVIPVFEFGSDPFSKLVKMIRVETIAEASRRGVDLIFTVCYAKDVDDEHMDVVTRAATDNGGSVSYVLLTCDKSELERRVIGESRKEFEKTKSVDRLRDHIEKYDFFSPATGRETLVIDTTARTPEDIAQQICQHFELDR